MEIRTLPLGAIGCTTSGPGLGPSVPNPPPLWQNLVGLALAAFGGHATLMAMAQGHAHGLCTTHRRHNVPLGAWIKTTTGDISDNEWRCFDCF